MYRGVPLMECNTWVLVDIALANPKSHNLTTPLADNKIFYGFMSLWIILLECR